MHPTVGCLVFLEKGNFHEVVRLLQQALHPLIPEDSWQPSDNAQVTSLALVGDARFEAQLHYQETTSAIFVFIDFDEDEIVNHARQKRMTIEELFSSYVEAVKPLKKVQAVSLGFELSPPVEMDDQSLREAGVAIIYSRARKEETWVRKQLLPVVGHYL